MLLSEQLHAVFPGRQAKLSAECPVEGGMVPVTGFLAHLFQRHAFPDQLYYHFHPAVGHKIVECSGCFQLEQLGHCRYADAAVGGDHLQGDFFRQMGVHISRDLIQKVLLSLAGTWAFLTSLQCVFRKGSLLILSEWKP